MVVPNETYISSAYGSVVVLKVVSDVEPVREPGRRSGVVRCGGL